MNEINSFSGLKVLDISQGVAGPYCANMLWQYGAEVIKIEPPDGDWGRHVGTTVDGQSALSISYNVGKKSVCVNAKQEAGREVIRKMAAECDVFVQNFRPGIVEKLGLSYEDLKKINPQIIYISISGYGPSGPYAYAPATDSVMQAETGIMSANYDQDGNPQKIAILMVDVLSGMYATQQALAAIYRRQCSTDRQGEHIQLNLFDACAAFQQSNLIEHTLNPVKVKTAVSAPNGVFNTRNGKLNVLALNNDQFERLCKALNKQVWLEDIRFVNNTERMKHRALLHGELVQIIAGKTTQEWQCVFSEHEVLHAPVRDYEQVMQHPQAVFNQTVAYFEQTPGQSLPYVFIPGLPQKPALKKAPDIGEHTIDVLQKFNFSQEQIETLIASQAIRQTVKESV
ncbi:MAG: CoA transferase [Advenella sp.]|nr:CoA transferase [Advenella sp.]